MINFLILGGVATGCLGALVLAFGGVAIAIHGLLLMLIGAVLFAGGAVAQEVRWLRPK